MVVSVLMVPRLIRIRIVIIVVCIECEIVMLLMRRIDIDWLILMKPRMVRSRMKQWWLLWRMNLILKYWIRMT